MEASTSATRRHTSSAFLVTLAALTLTVLLGAAPAHAAADQCRPGALLSPLPFSSFQGADGDQCNITGTAGSYDWQKIVADGGFGTGGGTTLIDNDTPTGQNVFSGGSKEQEPKDWGFTSDAPNNKTNVLAAWGYPDAQPNHLFLYLTFARELASGSVNYNFELNQNPPSATFVTSAGATVIKRRKDDILIAFDRTGNSAGVTVQLCRWKPASADPALAHLEGTWDGCTNITASGLAQAATNFDFPITNFLGGGAGATLGDDQFGEAAIDLTAALNLGGPGQAPCADFGAFWVRSRTSTSITSQPKDLIAPAKIGVNNCGRVIIKKATVGAATVPPTTFDFTANFNAVAEGMPDTTPTAFKLAGGDTRDGRQGAAGRVLARRDRSERQGLRPHGPDLHGDRRGHERRHDDVPRHPHRDAQRRLWRGGHLHVHEHPPRPDHRREADAARRRPRILRLHDLHRSVRADGRPDEDDRRPARHVHRGRGRRERLVALRARLR